MTSEELTKLRADLADLDARRAHDHDDPVRLANPLVAMFDEATVRNLLAALDEATRERDEARASLREAQVSANRFFNLGNAAGERAEAAERERDEALERASAAEGALTVRLALRREIEEALGMVPGLTDDQALQRGLDAVRALRERAETAERERDEARRELLDLDLVLPVACGSRVDAARQMMDDAAHARHELEGASDHECINCIMGRGEDPR